MFPKRKSDSLLWSDPRWRICQPAQEDAGKAASVPSEEAEAAYISHEFLNLSGQSSTVISVPSHFPLSHERRRDELAEEQVFNWIKKLEEIEGMRKVVFFHSLRCQGIKDEKDKGLGKHVARELDFSVYIDHRESKFNFLFEVKSYDDKAEHKNLYNPRKKNQLMEHVQLIKNRLNMTKDQAGKIHVREIWPNLKSNSRGAAYLLQNQRKPRTMYLFADDNFVSSIKSVIENPANAIKEDVWMKMLCLHTRLSCGVLYNHFSHEFTLLGLDQVNLRDSPEHDMSKPIMVEGGAGTGKTLTAIAKVKQLQKDGKLENKKVLFITFSDHMVVHVKKMFIQFSVDLRNITIVNYEKEPDYIDFYKNSEGMMKVLKYYSFIFMDETEELSISELELMCKSISEEDTPIRYFTTDATYYGIFWILFDPYQSNLDKHSLEAVQTSENRKEGELKWTGRTFKGSDHIRKLKTVFRMTGSNVEHITENHILPKTDIRMSHSIQGLKFPVNTIEIQKPAAIKVKLNQSIKKTIESVFKEKNVHPHKIAFLFNEQDFNIIFREAKRQTVGDFILKINGDIEKSMKTPTNARFLSSSLSDSLQKEIETLTSDPFQCGCSFYIGTVNSVKGLTIPIVHYIEIRSMVAQTNEAHICMKRTSSYYAALSRSSCEFHNTELLFSEKAEFTEPWNKHVMNIEAQNKGKHNIAIPVNENINMQWKILKVSEVVTSKCKWLSWSPNQRDKIISLSPDCVTFLNVSKILLTATEVKKLPVHWATCADVSRAGLLAAGMATGQVCVWSTEDYHVRHQSNVGLQIEEIKFSHLGKFLAVAGKVGSVSILETSDWKTVGHLPSDGRVTSSGVSWVNDATLAVYRNTVSHSASSDSSDTGSDTGRDSAPRVTTYSLPDCPVQQEYSGHTNQIEAMEGSQAAGQSATLPVQREYSGHTGEIVAMEGSQAAGRLATLSRDDTARIWGDGVDAIHVLHNGRTDEYSSVAWAPAGDVLATSSLSDGKIHLWSARSGQLLHSLDHGGVRCLAFSTGGPHLQLASGDGFLGDGSVITWSVETGKELSNTETGGDRVVSVAWSHGGDMLAVRDGMDAVMIVTL